MTHKDWLQLLHTLQNQKHNHCSHLASFPSFYPTINCLKYLPLSVEGSFTNMDPDSQASMNNTICLNFFWECIFLMTSFNCSEVSYKILHSCERQCHSTYIYIYIYIRYLVTMITWLSLLWQFYKCRAGKRADTWVIFASLPQNILQAPHSLN